MCSKIVLGLHRCDEHHGGEKGHLPSTSVAAPEASEEEPKTETWRLKLEQRGHGGVLLTDLLPVSLLPYTG